MGRKKQRFYKDDAGSHKGPPSGSLEEAGAQPTNDTNMQVLDSAPLPSGGASGKKGKGAKAKNGALSTAASKRREKALEKYIAKKLKKEERGNLLERLQKNSLLATVGSSVALQATKHMGMPLTRKQERLLQKQGDAGQGTGKCQDGALHHDGQADKDGDGLDDLEDGDDDGFEEGEEEFSDDDEGEEDDDEEEEEEEEEDEKEDDYSCLDTVFSTKRSRKGDARDQEADDAPSRPRKEADSDDDDDENQGGKGAQALPMPDTSLSKPAFFITVNRKADIQDQRSKLPIFAEEQSIMDAIRANPVVIICGETGSGKTTQVPQFLYEAGFGNPTSENPGMIGVTQPRRVAAVSMARRVGQELNAGLSVVAHQIRYDATNVSSATAIKFMTDGILLREIAHDFLLTKYSIIILDEAHERNLNTDILIGLLSRIVRLRNDLARESAPSQDSHDKPTAAAGQGPKTFPLRLVIMSATLNIEDFTRPKLFNPKPPVLNIEARQFPVSIHFSRKTHEDHAAAAFRMACKIHANLPPGGILIFMTGRQEIMTLVKKLRQKYPFKQTDAITDSEQSPGDDNGDDALECGMHLSEEDSDGEKGGSDGEQKDSDGEKKESSKAIASMQENSQEEEKQEKDREKAEEKNEEIVEEQKDVADLLQSKDSTDKGQKASASANGDTSTEEDDDDEEPEFQLDAQTTAPLNVLPLYSMLSPELQQRIFQQNPADTNSRLCVVATNVAETSITIPNIRYVIDCGKVKQRHYEMPSGIQRFDVVWTSKASATQRTGRAGRTGPGHVYRLYSSAVYDAFFPEFSFPEISRVPMEAFVLQLKSMNIDNACRFPLPTEPPQGSVAAAEKILTRLCALDEKSGRITPLGQKIALLPIAPHWAKMVVLACENYIQAKQQPSKKAPIYADLHLPLYVIALAATLAVGDPFMAEYGDDINHARGKGEEGGNDDDGYDAQDDGEEKDGESASKRHARSVNQVKQSMAGKPPTSDLLQSLTAFGAYLCEPARKRAVFCASNFLLINRMEEMRLQYRQLVRIAKAFIHEMPGGEPVLPPPKAIQRDYLRQLIAAALPGQIAERIPEAEKRHNQRYRGRKLALPTYRLAVVKDIAAADGAGSSANGGSLTAAATTTMASCTAYLHPTSVLSKVPPRYLVYVEAVLTEKGRFLKSATAIEAAWLPADFFANQAAFGPTIDE